MQIQRWVLRSIRSGICYRVQRRFKSLILMCYYSKTQNRLKLWAERREIEGLRETSTTCHLMPRCSLTTTEPVYRKFSRDNCTARQPIELSNFETPEGESKLEKWKREDQKEQGRGSKYLGFTPPRFFIPSSSRNLKVETSVDLELHPTWTEHSSCPAQDFQMQNATHYALALQQTAPNT